MINETFNAPKYKCKDCACVLQSQYPGNYVACNCVGDDFCAVDFVSSDIGRLINPAKLVYIDEDDKRE